MGHSTLLYYISWSFGYQHRNPNINIREIILLGNQLDGTVESLSFDRAHLSFCRFYIGNGTHGQVALIMKIKNDYWLKQ